MIVRRLNTECVSCLLNKYLKDIPKDFSKEQELKFVQGILRIIGNANTDMSAPEIVEQIDDFKRNFGILSDFGEVKSYFNKLMLSFENQIESKIENSPHSLKNALKYAMSGNFIDFGAMEDVNEEKLKETLDNAENIEIDEKVFEQFKKEILTAEKIVYLTDNCGEIVLDKLLIKQIQKNNTNAKIDVIVRGKPVLNDCTIDDAKEVGLDKLVTVTDNGTGVAGTALEKVSNKAKELIDNADVIISKGQGNFETLHHSGKNIYYLFLCKCKMFADRFGVDRFSGIFINDLSFNKENFIRNWDFKSK